MIYDTNNDMFDGILGNENNGLICNTGFIDMKKLKYYLFTMALVSMFSCRLTSGVMVANHGHGHHYDAAHDVQAPVPVAQPVTVRYDYYYYPDSYVYYNTHNSTYFYLSGSHWQSSTQLPRHIQLNEHRVNLSIESEQPYSRHQRHKKTYPGNHSSNPGNTHSNKHKSNNKHSSSKKAKHQKKSNQGKHSKPRNEHGDENKHDNNSNKKIIIP